MSIEVLEEIFKDELSVFPKKIKDFSSIEKSFINGNISLLVLAALITDNFPTRKSIKIFRRNIKNKIKKKDFDLNRMSEYLLLLSWLQ